MLLSTVAHAQEAAQQPSLFEGIMPFVFILIIFYFFLIRPQHKRQQKHTEFLKAMKRGDDVLTASGILGRVEGITPEFITLEIADGVRVRMLKSQIASPAKEEQQ